MINLNNYDRLLLVLIQRGNEIWNATDLVLLSGLSQTQVDDSLDKLEALGLIASLGAKDGHRLATSLTEKPLFVDNSRITNVSTTSPTGARSKNDLLMDLRERWSEHNRPLHFQHALAVLMGHIGLLRTHDVPLLHRATGFPLSFVSRVVFELLRSPLWHSDQGYVELVRTARCADVKELDSSLGELLQRDLFHEGIDSELEDDWYRLMGVIIEL